jgi:phosphoenolpyruvate-protein phosphotransferase
MAERLVRAVAAAPGTAVGAALPLVTPPAGAAGDPVPEPRRQPEVQRARAALRAADAALQRVATSLRAQGRESEAQIVEAGALMASDPSLAADVEAAILADGRSAAIALTEAAERHAEAIAALPDPTLAARADDVRSVGRRAAAIAAGGGEPSLPQTESGVVLIARDVGPADVAELGERLLAVALAAGGVTSHAAIVARSLGVPMVVAAGEEVLAAPAGAMVAVDGDEGTVVLDAAPTRVRTVGAAMDARARARRRAAAVRDLPAETRDGREVRVLTNAASAGEVALGLEAGAEGAGLVRTELAFLDASAWPTESEHRRALEPVLHELRGRTVTVRVLDFGGDKTPPFLRGTRERGLRLLLSAPEALEAQLRAILVTARDHDLRVLLPMVNSTVELLFARDALRSALDAAPGARCPSLGAMIETPRAASAAHQLAHRADFLSVGTNDLTHATLGSDRWGSERAPAHHPRVLRKIARSVEGAHAAGIVLEVCGEAASDPVGMPLLLGLGADELSVGAARVGTVREWVRALRFEDARAVARQALDEAGPDDVAALVAPLARALRLAEAGHAASKGVDGGPGVVAVSTQP